MTGTPSYSGFGATAGLTLTLATPATNVTFYDTATPPNPHVTASITNLTVTLSSVTTNKAIPATPGYNAASFTPVDRRRGLDDGGPGAPTCRRGSTATSRRSSRPTGT